MIIIKAYKVFMITTNRIICMKYHKKEIYTNYIIKIFVLTLFCKFILKSEYRGYQKF